MSTAERWKGHPEVPEDLAAHLPEVVTRLRQAGADMVYLFGSYAAEAGDRRPPPNDLDLAVFAMAEEPRLVRADLEDILGTDRLDLVRLEDADPELRFDVVSRGRLLHSRDTVTENAFELKVLREYRDLAPFRRAQHGHLRRRHGLDGA